MGQRRQEIIDLSDIDETRKRNLLREGYYDDEYTLVYDDVTYSDLEKGYQTYDFVLKRMDGKYFMGEYNYSHHWDDIDQIGKLAEVLKKSKVITYYE